MLRRAKRPSELRDSWRLPEIDHERGRGLRALRRWGSIAVVAVAFVFVNLLTDMLYSFIDPRIKYS